MPTSNQHKIDVHILHTHNENPVWWKRCQDSLIGEPINVFNLPGTMGDVREGRCRGFKQGTAEYVSFVDPDDTVIPGAFEQCARALDDNPHVCGVYTLSNVIQEVSGNDVIRGTIHPFRPWKRTKRPMLIEIHQIAVMRRSLLIPLLEEQYDSIPRMLPTEPWIYWALALKAPWLAIDFVGYNWRDNHYGVHRLRDDEITKDFERTYEFIRTSW